LFEALPEHSVLLKIFFKALHGAALFIYSAFCLLCTHGKKKQERKKGQDRTAVHRCICGKLTAFNVKKNTIKPGV
jgi:hypothetical protein